MRTVFGMKRSAHVAFAGILLLVAVLAVGAPECEDAKSYQLTISSTAGGTVTSPGEGPFNYIAGTVVELVATPDDGYEFRGWTGDIGQIADRNSPSTTIKMNGSYSVTAVFGGEGDGGGPVRP